MYRDARITRIYEGTNEINRMLVPTRLLKQSPGSFTADTARDALADRSVDPAAGGALAAEREFLGRLKRLAVALVGQASASLGAGLKHEQEILAHIADVIIEAYAVESGIARAEKTAARGDSRASLVADIARVYTCEAADRVARSTRPVVAALAARGGDAAFAAGVGRLTKYAGFDTIAARRRIADAVIEAGKYPM
jgi:alkylation response protein AidB-like acyl-CoA dehydrogenase